jgi:hypothetical protein
MLSSGNGGAPDHPPLKLWEPDSPLQHKHRQTYKIHQITSSSILTLTHFTAY